MWSKDNKNKLKAQTQIQIQLQMHSAKVASSLWPITIIKRKQQTIMAIAIADNNLNYYSY